MSIRSSRALRGAAFSAVATVTAATAHTLGGAAGPSPLFCAILFVFATPLAMIVASARPRLWRTAIAVSASQALFHGAFSLVGDLGAAPRSASDALHHHAHGAIIRAADAAVPVAAEVAHTDMTVAHVVAGVVTIALVLRGEAALAAIASWFAARAAVPSPSIALTEVPRRLSAQPARPRARLVVPPGLGRRGPPKTLARIVTA